MAPCRDYYDNNDASREELGNARERLNTYAKFLCEAMGVLDDYNKVSPLVYEALSPELKAWWTQHQEDDKKERQREKRARLFSH